MLKSAMFKAVVVGLIIGSFGCAASPAAKEQATKEVAVHEGYIRLIAKGGLTERDYIRMVVASRKGWNAQNFNLNDGPENPPELPEAVKIKLLKVAPTPISTTPAPIGDN